MYTVIGHPKTRCFRVIWMLEELGQPFDLDPAGPGSDTALAHNPSGKVPALVVDDETITDSTAILTFLADKHGALTHEPGTIARARQDAITHQILDEIDAVLWTAARHSFVLPEEHRVPDVKPSLKWEFERNLARLSSALTDPYLTGDMMTVPDIILGHCLTWARVADFPPADDHLVSYLKRLKARDGFTRAAAYRE